MLLPDSDPDIVRPLSRIPFDVEARVDRNLLNILTTSSTTSPSRRVEKARESLGLPAKPPLCAIACPTTCAIFDVADKDGVVHRHAGLRKKEAGQ